jgi:hypothetical protein
MEGTPSSPAPGWIACLTGHEFDLSHWERSLKPSFDPWCERMPRDGSLVLRSRTFADAQSAEEVRELAVSLIAQLNGALSVTVGTEPVNLQIIGHIDDTGEVHLLRHPRISRAT